MFIKSTYKRKKKDCFKQVVFQWCLEFNPLLWILHSMATLDFMNQLDFQGLPLHKAGIWLPDNQPEFTGQVQSRIFFLVIPKHTCYII